MSSFAGRASRACLLLLPLSCAVAQAQSRDLWVELSGREADASAAVASRMRVFDVDTTTLRAELMRGSAPSIELPLAEGGYATFVLEDSGTMHPELAAKFPEIRSLRGHDGEGRELRLDVSPAGVNAMIFDDNGIQLIRPRSNGANVHESFARADYLGPRQPLRCEVEHDPALDKALHRLDGHDHAAERNTSKTVTGGVRRVYRAAVAATGEYTTFHGGTVAQGQAAIVVTMNRVNAVYERDLSVRMQLIPNNNLIVYTNGATDPYSNGNPGTMINQNQTNLNAVIGNANFDVGHVVATNSGGLAGLGVICGSQKAAGVTGSGAPVGDPFDIDYVAHEIGHQFGGDHTFNGTADNCGGGNRSGSSAYEPGSGSTIMAYAGICGAQDLQPNSDAYFHARSLEQIQARITNTTCAVQSPANNAEPVIEPLQAYTIPARTPFALVAEAGDPDGDALTYAWEQYDTGAAQTGAAPSPTAVNGPAFRSFNPTPDPERIFPRLSSLLSNTSTIGETMPAVTRPLRFRVTARDGFPGGGATNSADVTLQMRDTGAAFAITAPNTGGTTWTCGTDATVTWNVAGTTANGIDCANVDLDLSQDAGTSFPVSLAAGVPNNGSATVRVPYALGTTTRMRASCSNNIFFDINNANLAVVAAAEPVAADDSLDASPEDAPRTITAAELTGNDTAGAGALAIASVSNAVNGSVELVDGDVVFTPAPDAVGAAGFEYALADNCARTTPTAEPATVSFELAPVNDAPTLAPLQDVTVFTLPGSGGVADFASVASFGPEDEAGQGVAGYIVEVLDDPDAIVDSVSIDIDGTLSYVLTGAVGSAQIAVSVRDDGGTDNGGVDTSEPQTFTLQADRAVDVRVRKTDGLDRAESGDEITYTITLEHIAGASTSVLLVDELPQALQDASWTCVGTGTACPADEGAGDVSLTVDLPAGASVVVSVTATVVGEIGDVVSNTAVAEVLDAFELTPEDNAATDETTLYRVLVFRDGFESVTD